MSVRTEPKDLSAQLQQTLTIPTDVIRQAADPTMVGAPMAAAQEGAIVPAEQALHSANDFNTNSPDHPLSRTVVVNIRSSLSDLCLRGAKATWAPPSTEATKAIFQQAHGPLLALTPSRSHPSQESLRPASPLKRTASSALAAAPCNPPRP